MAITTEQTGLPVDEVAITPEQGLPEALIMRASTVVTDTLDGDSPVVKVPWVDDADASFYP